MTEKPNAIFVATISKITRWIKEGTRAYNTVIQRINDPKPELCACEERVALAEHVELRVAIQDTCGHELVEDPDNERRKKGEEDVVNNATALRCFYTSQRSSRLCSSKGLEGTSQECSRVPRCKRCQNMSSVLLSTEVHSSRLVMRHVLNVKAWKRLTVEVD